MDTGIDDHLGIKLIMNFDVRLRRNHPFDVYTCHLSNVIYGYRDRNWAVRVDERFGGPHRAGRGRAGPSGGLVPTTRVLVPAVAVARNDRLLTYGRRRTINYATTHSSPR